MVIFPISCVLRGFMPSTYYQYASGINPCAALLIEKIPHFLIKIIAKIRVKFDRLGAATHLFYL
jgi:hypothetical protein